MTTPPTPSALQALPNAGLLRRLAAMLYDSLLVMAVAMAYGGLLLLIQVQVLGRSFAPGEKADMGIFGLLGLIAVICLFFCVFWRRGGQTLGMRAWRLRLVAENGEVPSWGSCLLRTGLAPLSLAAAGLGYLWCLLDQQGSTLHDRISRSRVVLLPKRPKNKRPKKKAS